MFEENYIALEKSNLPPSLSHTLERVFRSYSLVPEESGIRIMPAGMFHPCFGEYDFFWLGYIAIKIGVGARLTCAVT